ncbi:hypothetical protein FB45DRAFT_823492 [Roridomyces roridus]|uniref:F-box domain-containing protein n=1 Tax=Roridomyces roridus TaxID=1738132 RepID=A0AAD7FWT5_9AGAR|nr:hypothetical protein FB45DRAFT_823492 [Roridomyces roridus]
MSLVDSPFGDKLNTNYVPSDSEVAQLQALLREPVAELARLDAIISQLATQRASLQAAVDTHSALLSPIRRIPEDILREIFISCLPGDHDAFMDVTEAPMLLGHICGLWRRVGHSTPRLWSSVYIPPWGFDPNYPPEDIERKLATFLQAWLKRSKDCFLSISLVLPYLIGLPYLNGDQSYPNIISKQLLGISTRIRHLKYKGPMQAFLPLLELSAEALPVLESISIDFVEYSPWVSVQSALFRVPTLRRLSLRVANAEALALPIAWEQLTEVNLTRHRVPGPGPQGGFSAVTAFEVLRKCSSLIRCWLHVTVDMPLDQQPISLPCIQILSITIDFETAGGSVPEFLGYLTMPCLHYLQVGQDDNSPSFINSSSSIAEGLTVYLTGTTPIYPEMIIRLTQLFPDITHLRLGGLPEEELAMYYYGSFDDGLETIFTATACPSLRHLEMSKTFCTFSDDAVLAFILGRMETEHPLEQIDLHFDRAMEADIVEEPELEPYIAQGLRVNLRCRGKVVMFANSCYSGLLESPSWQLYCAGTATETPSALDLERYHAAVSIRERPVPTADYVAKTLRRLIPPYLALTTERMSLLLRGSVHLRRYLTDAESFAAAGPNWCLLQTIMSLADSPFTDKLNTNFVPSDSEVKQLNALLQEPVAKLALLDAMISHLVAERSSLQAVIDSHRALLSPIRCIPEDVLREIFISCLPDDHDAFMDVTQAPLLLGRVCGLWRRVAYSTPRLWSSVYIPPLGFDLVAPEDVERGLATFIKAWLERSKDCPLSISVALPFYSVNQEYPKLVLDHLLGVSRRIRHLQYKGPLQYVLPVLELGAEALPMLESVRVELVEYPQAAQERSALFRVPTLHRLTLGAADANALGFPLAWAQLTEINLTCYGVPGFNVMHALEVLDRCPSLIRCRLHVTAEASFTPRPIHLPHLQMLIILDLMSDDPVADFLECLTMPCLRYLQLGRDHNIPRFIDSSFANTKGLSVYLTGYTPVSQEMLSRITRFLPITHLRLGEPAQDTYNSSLYDDTLETVLTATACPSLHHLEICKYYCTFSDDAVLAFILGRMQTEHPLQQVNLEFARDMERDVVEELDPFIAQGLQVNLRYDSHSPLPWTFRGDAEFDERIFGY